MYEDTSFTEAGVKQREVLRNLAARAAYIMITLIEFPEEGLTKDAPSPRWPPAPHKMEP